ncbi:alcohol dehydrogenase [NADP(+)]-like isoform X2 [Trichoplusia ni]|uniref:Alcohol dehydrogenase [NADP(+)]-like isoform X2 n=1 Tax=Trichoplusia ni TaxID=7111 RepID=A0A7E5VBC4_TRINI|nr:alcohol dehydrogenase [NADP(+)]-like isoform X2 [Trichoplusia ni]
MTFLKFDSQYTTKLLYNLVKIILEPEFKSKAASRTPLVQFSNKQYCPVLGIGTWLAKPEEVAQAIKHAIDVGYRHIDCAFIYGNEKEVGEAITAKIRDGTVKREDLFITSKLWNTFHRPDLVKGALLKSLENLNIKYLDLYLIHWPQAYKEDGPLYVTGDGTEIQFSEVDYVDTWKALEPLVGEGLVRSIGVSNFNSKQLARLLQVATIKPVTNQVECHPYLNQRRLKDFCESHDIKITAYSPLGSPNRPWAKPDDPQLMKDPKLKAIADRLGKTVAQVLIRYNIDRGNIVIPKSVTKSRIASNFQVLDFKLSHEDMALIDSLDRNTRLVPSTDSLGHKHHPFENDEF